MGGLQVEDRWKWVLVVDGSNDDGIDACNKLSCEFFIIMPPRGNVGQLKLRVYVSKIALCCVVLCCVVLCCVVLCCVVLCCVVLCCVVGVTR